jgi:Skp family chaperone for outer membrane proteins
MNWKVLAALMIGLAISIPATHAADGKAPAVETSKAAPTKQGPVDIAAFDKQVAQMQENIKRMQEQMETIRQKQDPQERQKLLQDHWAAMQSNMQMMMEQMMLHQQYWMK